MLKGNTTALRAIEKEDLKQLLAWRNNPNLRKYFREYRELSSEHQDFWYNNCVLNDKNTIMFSIIKLDNYELIGACGLCYINWIDKNADFSIYIGYDEIYIDNTYADDASNVLLKYAFEEIGLHRVWAEIYEFDEQKKEMFNRLGFVLEGTQRETHWSLGKWWNSYLYSKLKYEFLQNSKS